VGICMCIYMVSVYAESMIDWLWTSGLCVIDDFTVDAGDVRLLRSLQDKPGQVRVPGSHSLQPDGGCVSMRNWHAEVESDTIIFWDVR